MPTDPPSDMAPPERSPTSTPPRRKEPAATATPTPIQAPHAPISMNQKLKCHIQEVVKTEVKKQISKAVDDAVKERYKKTAISNCNEMGIGKEIVEGVKPLLDTLAERSLKRVLRSSDGPQILADALMAMSPESRAQSIRAVLAPHHDKQDKHVDLTQSSSEDSTKKEDASDEEAKEEEPARKQEVAKKSVGETKVEDDKNDPDYEEKGRPKRKASTQIAPTGSKAKNRNTTSADIADSIWDAWLKMARNEHNMSIKADTRGKDFNVYVPGGRREVIRMLDECIRQVTSKSRWLGLYQDPLVDKIFQALSEKFDLTGSEIQILKSNSGCPKLPKLS